MSCSWSAAWLSPKPVVLDLGAASPKLLRVCPNGPSRSDHEFIKGQSTTAVCRANLRATVRRCRPRTRRMKVRRRSFLESRRAWLKQVLLIRLRSLDEPLVADAALRFLANTAARRLTDAGRAYGEVDLALKTARDLLNTVTKLDRPNANKPVSAALLRRLAEEQRLPRVPPWL